MDHPGWKFVHANIFVLTSGITYFGIHCEIHTRTKVGKYLGTWTNKVLTEASQTNLPNSSVWAPHKLLYPTVVDDTSEDSWRQTSKYVFEDAHMHVCTCGWVCTNKSGCNGCRLTMQNIPCKVKASLHRSYNTTISWTAWGMTIALTSQG